MNYIPKLYSLSLMAALSTCASTPEPVKVPKTVQKVAVAHNDHLSTYSRDVLEQLQQYAVSVKGRAELETTGGILVAKPQGSGLSLAYDYILTAAHLILPPAGAYQEGTITKSELKVEQYAALVVKQDAEKDLALLRVEDCSGCLPYFQGRLATKVETGDAVAGAGFKLGDKELFEGYVSGKREKPLKFISISASVSSGDSGSAVFVFEKGTLILLEWYGQ